jgi:hypothetical protein
MADVASLGLAVDSSQVSAATTALNNMTAAARPAEAAVSNLQKTAAAGASSQKQLAAAQQATADATKALSTQGQAAFHSLRGMTEQAALGVPVTTILAQQLNHLTFAASGPGGLKGAFNEVFGIVRGLLSPTVLLAGGVVGLAGGAYVAYSSWKNFALALDDTSKVMGTTINQAAKLQGAASFQGIDHQEFAASMKKAASSVYDAQHNMGALADLFRANGVQAGDFNDHLEKAADLMRHTENNQQRLNILGALGLPQTQEWVRLLEGGAEGLRHATSEAANFGDAANAQMIEKAREFDEAWNRTWSNFGVNARSAFVTVAQLIDDLGQKVNAGIMKLGVDVGRNLMKAGYGVPLKGNFDDFYSAVGVPKSGGGTNDPAVLQRLLALEQQRIGILGNLATVMQTVRGQEVAIQQARLNGVQISSDEEKRILDFARANALGLTQLRQQTEAYKTEAGAVGLGTGAAAAFRAEQEKLADFRIRGIKLTDDQAAALHREATALGDAAQKSAELRMQSDLRFASSQLGRTDIEGQVATQLRQLYGDDYQRHMDDAIAKQIRMNEALKDVKGFAQDALSGFIKDLRDGKSLGDSLRNVMVKLENKLIDIASNQIISGLFSSLLGGGTGTGTGILNAFGVHHTGYGPGDPIPRFHRGIGPGERPAIIRNDESVLTPGQMQALGRMAGGFGGGITVNVNNAPAGMGANVTATKEGDGIRIDLWLQRHTDDTSAALISHGQSSINQALERRYGLTPTFGG